MTTLLEERSLAERLQLRIAVEERFERTGKKFRNKPFFLQNERLLVRPLVKLVLQMAGLYAQGMQNALAPVVRRLTLHFADLPPAFEGFQILHLSDLHVDGMEALVPVLVSSLRHLHPDICVITGDYRFEDDGPCHDVYPHMRSIVSSISAKQGIYGILGNHDVSEIAFALEEMGVRMLINEAVEIRRRNSSIWLAGIDDNFDYRCDDLPGALAPVPSEAFKILLAHTPELYSDAAAAGVDLYLCGHTHAGQIRFPKIGSLRHNADCPRAYSYGHWWHKQMQAYTSPGVGCSGLPVRYNCPPELVLIELCRVRH